MLICLIKKLEYDSSSSLISACILNSKHACHISQLGDAFIMLLVI
jgi:hypothetical protein